MEGAFTQQWVPGADENAAERDEFLGLLAGDFYRGQLIRIMTHGDDRRHFGLDLRLQDLLHACPELGSRLSADPKAALVCLENWLHAAQSNIVCGPSLIEVGCRPPLAHPDRKH